MEEITTLGLDTAKSVFHVTGLNRNNKVVVQKRLRRKQLLSWFAQLPPTVVGIETCAASHHWGRQLVSLGHTVKLVPTRDVQALVRGQKNDYHDALAIAEAVGRPQQRFVRVKTLAAQELQTLNRLREGAISDRTALSNRLRGMLAEYGLVFPKGLHVLRRALPLFLEDADNDLGSSVRESLQAMLEHLRHLDALIADFDRRLADSVRDDEQARALITIPGIGPVVASSWCAKFGDCRDMRRGRDAAARIGLVPRQDTTGGKPRLLGITKTGDKQLRTQLIHGARAVLAQAHRKDDALSRWACDLKARRGSHKATVALANKLARIAWAVSVNGGVYEPRRVN